MNFSLFVKCAGTLCPPEHQDTFRVTPVLHQSTVNVYLFVKRQQLDNLCCERHASRFPNTSMTEQQAERTHGNHAKCPKFFGSSSCALKNRLQASRAKESDVLSLLQRHAALMRREPGEKVYEERARGQKSCWTKILKSSPAMAEPSDTRCVNKIFPAI